MALVLDKILTLSETITKVITFAMVSSSKKESKEYLESAKFFTDMMSEVLQEAIDSEYVVNEKQKG